LNSDDESWAIHNASKKGILKNGNAYFPMIPSKATVINNVRSPEKTITEYNSYEGE